MLLRKSAAEGGPLSFEHAKYQTRADESRKRRRAEGALFLQKLKDASPDGHEAPKICDPAGYLLPERGVIPFSGGEHNLK